MDPDPHSGKIMGSGSAFKKMMDPDPHLVKIRIRTFGKLNGSGSGYLKDRIRILNIVAPVLLQYPV